MATKAELQARLDAAGVEYPSDALKADLEELAAGLPEPAVRATIEPGGIDPALVEARDAAREVEASTRVGRVRPTPARIDPRLVEIAEATRAADDASIRPATATPDRG